LNSFNIWCSFNLFYRNYYQHDWEVKSLIGAVSQILWFSFSHKKLIRIGLFEKLIKTKKKRNINHSSCHCNNFNLRANVTASKATKANKYTEADERHKISTQTHMHNEEEGERNGERERESEREWEQLHCICNTFNCSQWPGRQTTSHPPPPPALLHHLASLLLQFCRPSLHSLPP